MKRVRELGKFQILPNKISFSFDNGCLLMLNIHAQDYEIRIQNDYVDREIILRQPGI